MSGSTPTNTSAVDFEKQQAAQADAKEAQRQADLQSGISAINAIYDPQPVMKTTQTPFDWSTFQGPGAGFVPNGAGGYMSAPASGVPAGYTAVQVPGKASTSATQNMTAWGVPFGGAATTAAPATDSGSAYHGQYETISPKSTAAAGATSAPTWGLQDSSGKVYNPGDPLSISSQTPTGQTTGGFGDPYYNAYKQKILDYYQPDEQRQYDEAQRNLQYSLARAGTLQSSVAADKQGELAYQDAINKAQIVSNANDQTGQLRDTINFRQAVFDQSALHHRRSDPDREPGAIFRQRRAVEEPDADADGRVVQHWAVDRRLGDPELQQSLQPCSAGGDRSDGQPDARAGERVVRQGSRHLQLTGGCYV